MAAAAAAATTSTRAAAASVRIPSTVLAASRWHRSGLLHSVSQVLLVLPLTLWHKQTNAAPFARPVHERRGGCGGVDWCAGPDYRFQRNINMESTRKTRVHETVTAELTPNNGLTHAVRCPWCV